MSKATLFYILMTVGFIAGLWGVMRLGTRLEAPEDLSGVWDLEPGHSVVSADDVFAGPVRIYQSGRFFNIAFDSGQRIPLRLSEQRKLENGTLRWQLDAEQWTLVIEGSVDPDELKLHLNGPSNHAWDAIRAREQPLVAAPLPTDGKRQPPPTMATSNAP